MTPFTTWDEVPLTCRIADAVRVLRRSRRSIERDLRRGSMRPAPIERQYPREPWTWSKQSLMDHVNGVAAQPGRRRFFGTARPSALSA